MQSIMEALQYEVHLNSEEGILKDPSVGNI